MPIGVSKDACLSLSLENKERENILYFKQSPCFLANPSSFFGCACLCCSLPRAGLRLLAPAPKDFLRLDRPTGLDPIDKAGCLPTVPLGDQFFILHYYCCTQTPEKQATRWMITRSTPPLRALRRSISTVRICCYPGRAKMSAFHSLDSLTNSTRIYRASEYRQNSNTRPDQEGLPQGTWSPIYCLKHSPTITTIIGRPQVPPRQGSRGAARRVRSQVQGSHPGLRDSQR